MQELKFLSIGGATNVELGGNCAYLKHKDTLLLIDCCEDAAKKIFERDILKNINHLYIVLTHMHFDHVAGIGTLIWFCNFRLNIKPKIIINSNKFKKTLTKFLKLGGVSTKYIEFINQKDLSIDNLSLETQKTNHSDKLECYGIMFKDSAGKYYYSGDTRDFEKIKTLTNDPTIKTIYCEVSEESYDVHIKYADLKTLNKEKLVLMHFNSLSLYNQAIKDGFKIANLQ